MPAYARHGELIVTFQRTGQLTDEQVAARRRRRDESRTRDAARSLCA
jgi:hypothetical protein